MPRLVAALAAVLLAALMAAVPAHAYPPVSGLQVSGTTDHSISLDWDDYTGGTVRRYQVAYRADAASTPIVASAATSAFTLDGLGSGDSRDFRVRAVLEPSGGTTDYTAWLSTSTRRTLFSDEFNGPSIDTSKWIVRGGSASDMSCGDSAQAFTCYRSSNVFTDGAGNAVLRVQREPSGIGPKAEPFSGAMMATAHYGWGWPVPDVRASWPTPHRIEMRALMPAGRAVWPIAWEMNTKRGKTDHVYELDFAEERMTNPAQAHAGQHDWLNGADAQAASNCYLTVSDMSANWHVFAADVTSFSVTYSVDGVPVCSVAPFGVDGDWFLILSSWMGRPSTWGAGYASADPADAGPWDERIDYVRVTAL